MILDINTAKARELFLLMEEFEKQISALIGKSVKLKITSYTDPNDRDLYDEKVIIDRVKAAIKRVCGIADDQLVSNARTRDISDVRFIAYHIIKTHSPNITLKEIALCFGGKDHSSVIHGLHKFEDYRANEPDFRKKYEAILNQFNQTEI